MKKKDTQKRDKSDREKMDLKDKRETVKIQKQLIRQLIEEFGQLWEGTPKNKNEINYLKTQIKQQQEKINLLTTEKHEQHLLIKRLRLQIKSVTEDLREKKHEATQEEIKLKEMLAEIHQERETLERKCKVITDEQKFEIIKYEERMSEERKESSESMSDMKKSQDEMGSMVAKGLVNLIEVNQKIMLITKQAKEEIEKKMADMKHSFKRSEREVTQHTSQIEQIKYNSTNMKEWLAKIQRDVRMQKATNTEMESKERQEERKDTLDTLNIKFSRIMEEIDKLWEMLNLDSELAQIQSERQTIEKIKAQLLTETENLVRDRQLANAEMDAMKRMKNFTERHKQELDDKLQRTKKDIQELEAMSIENDIKKKDMIKILRMISRKKNSMMMVETEHAEQGIEDQSYKTGQTTNQVQEVDTEDGSFEQKIGLQQGYGSAVMPENGEQFEEDCIKTSKETEINIGIHRVILDIEEIREMLCRLKKDEEQNKRDIADEKKMIKWMNLQMRRKKLILDQQLERAVKERDEAEMVKIKIQGEREKNEQKLVTIRTTILSIGEMKMYMKEAVADIKNTVEEMLKVQMKMKENKEGIQKDVVIKCFFRILFPPNINILVFGMEESS